MDFTLLSVGVHGRLVKAQMDATESVVRNVGWLDECPDGKIEINITPSDLENDKTASQWKAVVQRKQQ